MQRIFIWAKVKKSGLILGFGTIIVGFYLVSFFLSADLFAKSSESFTYFKAASRRGPGLTNALVMYLEKVSQNATITFGNPS